MINRGKIVEEAIRRSGIPITQVAVRIGKSQRHMYNLFEEEELSLDIITRIGKAISYDFASEIPELKKFNTHLVAEDGVTYESNFQKCLEEKEQMKNDLYAQIMENNDLLKKHVLLLEGKLSEYFNANPDQKQHG